MFIFVIFNRISNFYKINFNKTAEVVFGKMYGRERQEVEPFSFLFLTLVIYLFSVLVERYKVCVFFVYVYVCVFL